MAILSPSTDLKLSKGWNTKRYTDGSWTFTPSKDWNGEVEFSYGVTDGNSDEGWHKAIKDYATPLYASSTKASELYSASRQSKPRKWKYIYTWRGFFSIKKLCRKASRGLFIISLEKMEHTMILTRKVSPYHGHNGTGGISENNLIAFATQSGVEIISARGQYRSSIAQKGLHNPVFNKMAQKYLQQRSPMEAQLAADK